MVFKFNCITLVETIISLNFNTIFRLFTLFTFALSIQYTSVSDICRYLRSWTQNSYNCPIPTMVNIPLKNSRIRIVIQTITTIEQFVARETFDASKKFHKNLSKTSQAVSKIRKIALYSSSSSSGGTLEEHSRLHDASPGRTIRCSP